MTPDQLYIAIAELGKHQRLLEAYRANVTPFLHPGNFALLIFPSVFRMREWSEALTLDMEADAATRFMVPSEPEESKQHRYRYIAEKRKMAEHLRELAKKAKF